MDISKARSRIINMEINLRDIRNESDQLAMDLCNAGHREVAQYLFEAETPGHKMNLLLIKAIGKI